MSRSSSKLVLLTASIATSFALTTSPALAATSLPNFSVSVKSASYAQHGVTGLHVKSIRIYGPGAKTARPYVTCSKTYCGSNRLFKGKRSRTPLYRESVTFSNVGWIVAPGKSFRVNMLPRKMGVQGVYVQMVPPDAHNKSFTAGEAGCINRKLKAIPCPPGIVLPTLNHKVPKSPAAPANCPKPTLATSDLAGFLGHNPVGTVDHAIGTGGNSIFVNGWAFDPDAPNEELIIDTYVDAIPGSMFHAFKADVIRTDVNDVYPGANSNHGFRFQIPDIPTGAHTLWVYAINVREGTHKLLWTGPVTDVAPWTAGSPSGSFDAGISVGCDSVRLAGWAIDFDMPKDPVNVHIYVDGWSGDLLRIEGAAADLARPDLATAFPEAGAKHAFDTTINNLAPGRHAFFIYALNNYGPGTNPLLGVRYVTVPGG